jgi:hypothetical protein
MNMHMHVHYNVLSNPLHKRVLLVGCQPLLKRS